jgi:D-glycero-D-manno-heptose 1,7-bisphosphate phosphatase
MLFSAQRDHHLDLTRTVFVGDDERDGEAARAAGCPFVLVEDGRGLLDVTREVLLPAVEVAA